MEKLYYTRLLLVRHGQAREADGSYLPETRLSELGRLQAKALGEAVSGLGEIGEMYSSPYPRAVETARAMAGGRNRELIVKEELSEIHVPVTSLHNLKAEKYLELWKPEHRAVDGEENVRDFFARVWSICEQICREHRDTTVAVVAHAGTITAVYRWALGIVPEAPWTFMIEVGNATISEIEVWPNGKIRNGSPRYSVIKSVGRADHLKGIESRY
jgi:broad specificity phosphatase PhoE